MTPYIFLLGKIKYLEIVQENLRLHIKIMYARKLLFQVGSRSKVYGKCYETINIIQYSRGIAISIKRSELQFHRVFMEVERKLRKLTVKSK